MRRILAVLITLIQITGSVAQAQAEATFWSQRRALSSSPSRPLLPPLLSSRITKVDIPLINGTVRETYKNGAPKIVLIQDIHLNSEAQRNIAAILQNLIDKKAVDLVAVEGAFEVFNFKPFREGVSRELARDVADKFLQNNQIGAPSYVGVTSTVEPPLFIGVDDPAQYEANVNAYLDSLKKKKETERRLAAVENKLAQERKNTFSRPLKVFDQAVEKYEVGADAVGFILQGLPYGWRSEQIDAFMRASRLEKTLDMKRVERERSRILERLAEKMGTVERAALMAETRRYEEGAIRYAELYTQLEILFKRHAISLESTPAFRDYLRYVAYSDKIDGEMLLNDIERFKAETFSRLARTSAEKNLISKLTWLRLAKKLTTFSLTPGEWETYKAKRDKTWAEYLSAYERFYIHAEIRSQKMVRNVLAAGARNTVLITGGFHSPHIKHLLKKRGVSYTLVSPKMTTIEKDGGTGYLSVFTQEKSPLEAIFSGEKLFINPSMLALGTQEGRADAFLNAVSVQQGKVPSEKATPMAPSFFDWLKRLFPAGSQSRFKLKTNKRFSFEKLEERRYAAADLAVDVPALVSQLELPTYVQVAPTILRTEPAEDISASVLDQAFSELVSASLSEESTVVLSETPDFLEEPILPRDQAFATDFEVDSGRAAAAVNALAPVEFDFTKVGALISPDILQADEQGNRPIFGLSIFPETYINSDPEVKDGYALLRNVDQGVTISRLVLDNALIEISLTPLNDVKTDLLQELALLPLEKQDGTGVPAPIKYAATVKASQLSINEFGEMSLRIASPFSEEELQALKDGSILLTVRAILLDGEGNVVLDADGKEVAIALPTSVSPGNQAALVTIGPGIADNVEFDRQDDPANPVPFPFSILSQEQMPIRPLGRQGSSSGGGSGASTGGGGGGGGGAQSVAFGERIGGFRVSSIRNAKPIPLTLSPLDLYEDIFDKLKRLKKNGEKEAAPEFSDLDDIVGVDLEAIEGEGDFVSFQFENLSDEPVQYWVVVETEEKTVVYGPYDYSKEGDNYDFAVPPGGKIYFVLRDPGDKKGLSKVLPQRIEFSENLPPGVPREIEDAKQQSPGNADESDADTSKKQASGALLVLPVAFVVARDAILARMAQAKEILKPRASSAPLVPTAPEPRPKEPEPLSKTIPLEPLFGVSKFGQAVAKKNEKDILAQRPWVYVPKSGEGKNGEKELMWEVWGRYRTLHAISPNPHMEIFLTAANEKHADKLREVYGNMSDRVKIRRPGEYDSLDKLRSIFDSEKLPGQIQFLIRQGAAVDENFLRLIYELSKSDGFVDRINVLLIIGTTLRGEAGRLQSLDQLINDNVWRLIRSQA